MEFSDTAGCFSADLRSLVSLISATTELPMLVPDIKIMVYPGRVFAAVFQDLPAPVLLGTLYL